MKKIVIFTGYYLPHTGGVENYTYHIAKEFVNQGNKVYIVTAKYDNNLPKTEEIDGITIYRLPTHSLFVNRHPILKFNKEQKEVIKELELEKIDFAILQTRFWLTTIVGGRFAKKNNIQRILIEHGTSHFTVHNKILDFIGTIYEHILTGYVKTLVTNYYGVSKQCNKWLEHFKMKAKGVLYNSIDIKEYELYKNQTYPLQVEKNTIKILFVGRMIKDKGILELIQSYKNLKQKCEISLILAGDGPLFDKLKKENPDIIFTGNLKHDEVMSLYNSVDIFINPSYSEGLPTTVLEAGLMKCPVVATNVGGTGEIIEDKKEGILCNPTTQSIQEALEEMIENKNRKQYGDKIHQKILDKFAWEKNAKKILDIIK